jgi:hypothetical protein
MKKTVSIRNKSCFLCGEKDASIFHPKQGPILAGYKEIGTLEPTTGPSFPVYQFEGDLLPQHNSCENISHPNSDISAKLFTPAVIQAAQNRLSKLRGVSSANIALGTYSDKDARDYVTARVQLTLTPGSPAPSSKDIHAALTDTLLPQDIDPKSLEFSPSQFVGRYVFHVKGMMCSEICPSTIETAFKKQKLDGTVTFVDSKELPGKNVDQKVIISSPLSKISKVIEALSSEGFTITRMDITQGTKIGSLSK